jgi:hypothetical protein
MSVSPPGHWLLNRMVFLLNRTLGIINSSVLNSIINLLKDANTFTGINTFKGGINVDNIDSINGNTTFNSEIIVNSNIIANNGSFIGDNLVINNIEKNTNSNVIFQSSIDMNDNNINNVDTIFSNTVSIDTISLQNSNLPYITVQDDIRFNDDVNVIGKLIVNGSFVTVNRETLTINDRFIVLNANIGNSQINHTDPTGIIVDTHNTTEHSRGYLLWTLFDSNDPTNTELNRTWDLSGDNLRGNVLKATTIRGNILDSYYSPNISVISDINMSNNDISNINILTAKAINIDIIKTESIFSKLLNTDVINTNIASNISILNTIDMNNHHIINANIAALNHSQINVENGLINSRNLTLGGFNADLTNGVTFRARYGLNILGNTRVVLFPTDTLYLPENNGMPFGSYNSNHTQSIIGIGGVYKAQDNTQQFLNSNCYLIPPSMVSNENDLKGTTLFETIGERTKNIQHLAGYPNPYSSINELRNTLVPTVGQIVDLLNYLDVEVNTSKAGYLESTYS